MLTRNSKQIKKPRIFHTLQRNLFTKTDYNKTEKNINVKTGIQITPPDNIVGILMSLPDICITKLKYHNLVNGHQNIEFDFINIFTETFTFRRRNTLVILMLIEVNEKKDFNII